MSLFRRYVTILTPIPLRPSVPSLGHLCLTAECLHNSDVVDLNAYATFLRRYPRIARDNSIKSTETTDSTTKWRQIEFITHEVNKTVRTISGPRGLRTTPRPTKSVTDYVATHASLTPNRTLEKDVRIHIHSEFYKTLDKFERKFYMVSFNRI